LTTQVREDWLKCRSCWIDGSATFTIVASRTIISWARRTAMSAAQRRCSPSRDEKKLITGMKTVTLLNDVEAAGWAERRRDTEDRRRHVVDITEAGREALFRAERALDGLEEDVLGDLSPDERETLRDLLSRALAAAPVPA
jgi:hypothetical protein